ncbi:MAG: DUF3944 domain-containing protein [Methylobacter sp.]|uniref:DUF3944 domain-containing protein n=1 Tax=Methylobacter sp. TaxID=2051955 RepID=UPI0025E105A3|nr:DUF3944 domain-containing protein [Methylobacter sp.]MCK9619131.1 DUF3944 domain-containing protein [Methylobacter sp.]
MGIKYREDADLDFLQYCAEDDLQVLARYMTHDKDGGQRTTSELLEDKEFKRYAGKSDQYKTFWKLIAGELQHFGGDTLVNLFRGTGVVYKEILSDVCEKLKVKFEKNDSAYEIENKLLGKVITDSWENMSDEQKKELLKGVGLDSKLTGSSALLALQTVLKLGGAASYNVSTIVASSIAATFAGRTLAVVAGGGAARSLAILTGPIGIAITTLLTIPAISGAAYRVTIPLVCQIAYMRRAYAEQDRF